MARKTAQFSRRTMVKSLAGATIASKAALPATPIAAMTGTTSRRSESPWPPLTKQCRPWCYNWWMGSAVDPVNLSLELRRYKAAGMGGVHIIPIYGARGWETRYIPYLTRKWMQMLHHDRTETDRLGMGVDMTTGTGWNFGGPDITGNNASLYARPFVFNAPAGASPWTLRLPRGRVLYARAFSADGRQVEIPRRLIRPHGAIAWPRPAGRWKLVVLASHPGSHVKRAAPGGHGMMINTIYPPAIAHFLKKFTRAFAAPGVKRPRAMYHDSYEYFTGVPRGYGEWSPDFFDQFARLRGYRLEEQLLALAGDAADATVGRVQADYRETVSDLIVESVFPQWAAWCRKRGILTRNQAHGSPTNLLDFYNVADIPEPEGNFGTVDSIGRCHPLIAKFASSPAHIAGKPLISSETGTWLAEHFTVTLADMKGLVDQFFLGGVNHVFYHGTCYSPDDAAWPGWLFYAATDMNPRMSIWRDARTLNDYIARCQSVLQVGKPDNDILLYWPIHDQWHQAGRMAQYQTMTNLQDWFYNQPIGKTAEVLWGGGFSFDYLSDRLLSRLGAANGTLIAPGGAYAAIVVPPIEVMPVPTLKRLIKLATDGATIVFANHLPKMPPGLGRLAENQAVMTQLINGLHFVPWKAAESKVSVATVGAGRIFKGPPEVILPALDIRQESLCGHAGLHFIRRQSGENTFYFLAYQGKKPLNGRLALATPARQVTLMDPMTGQTVPGHVTQSSHGPKARAMVEVNLQPGHSLILRTTASAAVGQPVGAAESRRRFAPMARAGKPSLALTGPWDVDFIDGGPELPRGMRLKQLASWTTNGDPATDAFAGTARYSINFDAPTGHGPWLLDLGRVSESAKVWLNGRLLAGLILPPYNLVIDELNATGNLLEVEVTNLPANRIREMDRRGVKWQIFHDINFASINYHHFNASHWKVRDSGLLGPVRLFGLG